MAARRVGAHSFVAGQSARGDVGLWPLNQSEFGAIVGVVQSSYAPNLELDPARGGGHPLTLEPTANDGRSLRSIAGYPDRKLVETIVASVLHFC